MSALLGQTDTATVSLSRETSVNLERLREGLAERIEALPQVTTEKGEARLSSGLHRMLNLCDKLARERGDWTDGELDLAGVGSGIASVA